MDAIQQHCQEIENCNQRGGRMLSIVDLLESGTVTRELTHYLLATIGSGASFMVGARPGGAGKTTVMGALLNFVPPEVPLRTADSLDTIQRALSQPQARACYLCHEIGPGDYYAYLWDEPLRAYFQLPLKGHLLATNLHADTLDEALAQVCQSNQVPFTLFQNMHLVLFLKVSGGWHGRREITDVWESNGQEPHQRVYEHGNLRLHQSRLCSPNQYQNAASLLDHLLPSKARTIQEVRVEIVRKR